MKINTIIHDKSKERKNDLHKNSYNKEIKYHPFIQEREYIRALNSVKIERMLAKPFIKAYNYHLEGITHLTKQQEEDVFASASFDNSIYIWDIKGDKKIKIENNEKIKGLSFLKENLLIANNEKINYFNSTSTTLLTEVEGINSINSSGKDYFVSTYRGIKVFDLERKFSKMSFGNDFCNFVEPNPVLENLIAFSEEKNLNLIDIRANEVFSTLNLGIKTNCIKFNHSGNILASGNENSSLYIHDLRYLQNPLTIFKHHLNSINTVDFYKKIVTGSSDQTIRIFDLEKRKCMDVYYNKRMHLVNGVKFNNTEEFIISGSDDGSLRVWKTNASKKIGPLTNNEIKSQAYGEALKEKFKFVNEIKRISNQRMLPKSLKGKIRRNIEMQKARERKNKK